MTTNKDGLEPGQPVEFEAIQRIEKQRAKQPNESRSEAPKRRSRKADAEE